MSRLRYGSTPPALLILLLLALVPARAPAQELSGFWGGQYTPGLGEGTYSYAFQYLHNLDDNFVATFTWLNEGHVTNHHRDGHSIQLWYRWLTPDRRLTFSAGLGPYRYYDTTIPEGSTQSTDAHGFGVMASAAVSWYYQYPWVATLRYNYSYTTTSITTHTLQIGIGYQFDAWTRAGPVVPRQSTDSPSRSATR